MVIQRKNPQAGNKWNYKSGNWFHEHGKLLCMSTYSNKNRFLKTLHPTQRDILKHDGFSVKTQNFSLPKLHFIVL